MERVMRIIKCQSGTFGGAKGWLVLTDKRLVFSKTEGLGEKIHWAVSLDRIQSAQINKPLASSIDQLHVHVLGGGPDSKRTLESVRAGRLFQGPFGRAEPNVFTGMEVDIVATREKMITDHRQHVASLEARRKAGRAEAASRPATKSCPDCAEEILAAAKVCRFCRYRFED